jgi:AcrR family transcriptional regulator
MTENKKYVSILETARSLFWKHGFRRISVEEICKKAGVSKMTFYRFFPNKTELAKTVYAQEVEKGITAFRSIMTENLIPQEKIKKLMLLKLEGTNDISHEFIMDFYSGTEPGLKNFIDKKTNELCTEILKDFKKAQKEDIFRKDLKPEFILSLSQKVIELASDKNLLELYNNQQELIMELTNFFVYGISPHD